MSNLLFLATTMLSPFCFSWRDWVSMFTTLQIKDIVMMTTTTLTFLPGHDLHDHETD